MTNPYSVTNFRIKAFTDQPGTAGEHACPSRSSPASQAWTTPSLEGKEHERFVNTHANLCAYSKKTFADIYRDFSDQNDLFLLSDAHGRLITLHCASDAILSATRKLGLVSGILLNEASCGSTAILMALRYREAMVTSNSDFPLEGGVTVAVPLLDDTMQAKACVAVLNRGEGLLGEKLLLAKFVARELSRFYSPTSGRDPLALRPAQHGTRRSTDNADDPSQPLPTSPTQDTERRRGEDRRQRRAPRSAQQTSVKLTRRQEQVLKLFAQGKGYKEIARAIGITSYKTVEEHLDAVREKLKVEHRRECIHKAMSLGLI